jgi:glucose/mannose-6-phosphate isomerase
VSKKNKGKISMVDSRKFDTGRMKERIESLPNQIWEYWKKGLMMAPGKTLKPNKVVVCGMGGSAIAGDLLADLLFEELNVPLMVNRGYSLPSFVDSRTLLLISSYSGNTEETLYSLKEGLNKDAMLAVFTSNGEAEKIAREKALPTIKFPKGYPPRSALGFSFSSMLGFIKNVFSISIGDEEIEGVVSGLERLRDNLVKEENEISSIAVNIKERLIYIYISRRLKSVALRWQTQLNENSKTFAHINVIPEMNHNEIVGMKFPKHLIEQVHILLLRSAYFENERIKKRFTITENLLGDCVADITTIEAEGKSGIEEMFSLVFKGDFLSYYLSQILNVDPTPVKRIDMLKKKLME